MTKNKKGFTIIEVVLVLAIAGLIFLMVFIALPALQRSQRNTQRKDDLARMITAITEYKSNNSNKNPFENATTIKNLTDKYVKGTDGKGKSTNPNSIHIKKDGFDSEYEAFECYLDILKEMGREINTETEVYKDYLEWKNEPKQVTLEVF